MLLKYFSDTLVTIQGCAFVCPNGLLFLVTSFRYTSRIVNIFCSPYYVHVPVFVDIIIGIYIVFVPTMCHFIVVPCC